MTEADVARSRENHKGNLARSPRFCPFIVNGELCAQECERYKVGVWRKWCHGHRSKERRGEKP